MKDKIIKELIMLSLLILLVLNFAKNFLGDGGGLTFATFQNDSEHLVISEIFTNKYGIETEKYGLCGVSFVDNKANSISELRSKMDSFDLQNEKIEVGDYTSQFGLQGHIFSLLYNVFHFPIWSMKLLCCFLLAIIIIYMCYLISKKYNILMGAIFYITFLLSPWVVAFARNLYWVEFTWFLPVLFGLLISINYSKKKIFVPCIFVAILIKCLCGYEYITSIMLMTISFFIIDLFVIKDKSKRKEIFKTIIIVGIICLLAFVVALCIHAILKGNGNVLNGLIKIYNETALRTSFSSATANRYTGLTSEAMRASIGETVNKYFAWRTNVILGIDGKYFNLLFYSTITILIYNALKKEENSYRDMIMFVVFLITTLSWFVLGKAHSYVHIYMNFVLWYFGFVQICMYIIVKFITKKFYQIGKAQLEN